MVRVESRLLDLRRQYSSVDRTFLEKQAIYDKIKELEQQVSPVIAKAIAQQVAQEHDVPAEQMELP